MMNVRDVRQFAERHALWVVEDAAHAFPAAWRPVPDAAWQQCGEHTADVSCFSFYANKTITTGEGGMTVTDRPHLLEHMRMMALHGLSSDAWNRYSGTGGWDYEITAPGFKYNLTDIAAAIGLIQLSKAEEMRRQREAAAAFYLEVLGDIEEIELPPVDADRRHAWHLFPIKLQLDKLAIGRAEFIAEMRRLGIACSVHWRPLHLQPLHLHPYYQETFGWTPADLPVASAVWPRLVSLPIFSNMRASEMAAVALAVRHVCVRHSATTALGVRERATVR
jgi:dTDP-4-amino-4,6-dideoxygalactose transaminase